MKTVSSVRSKDGTVIAFDRSGSGPALVLVGGAFQFRAFDQRTQQLASILSARFDVYHYDRRGRGESTDTLPYAVEREVEDLDAIIAAAGGNAYVFGMSSGAVLALRAAASGLAIRKLALYEPPFNNPAMDSYTKELTSLLAEGRRGDAAALAMKTFGAPPEAVAGARQSPAWPLFESVAPTLAYDNAVMGGSGVPKKLLASISIPALVMDGGASPAFMREAARETAAALPQGRSRTFEGQTHAVAPEVLAPALVEFFAE